MRSCINGYVNDAWFWENLYKTALKWKYWSKCHWIYVTLKMNSKIKIKIYLNTIKQKGQEENVNIISSQLSTKYSVLAFHLQFSMNVLGFVDHKWVFFSIQVDSVCTHLYFGMFPCPLLSRNINRIHKHLLTNQQEFKIFSFCRNVVFNV